MLKAVFFDCDGVLINTEEIGYKILSGMMARIGMSYTREKFVEVMSGITYAQFIEQLAADYREAKSEELPGEFQEELTLRMREAEDTEMHAIEGVRELLENLRKHNIPFAVCSNSGRENLLRKLEKAGLIDYFAPHIYSRNDVDNPKPAPDMYLKAARDFRVDPKDCYVVEDSMTGTIAGVAAQMTVCGFVGEAHREDFEAEFLIAAGASMVAPDMKSVWQHIVCAAGINIDSAPAVCAKPPGMAPA